jgi:hypothetical protein
MVILQDGLGKALTDEIKQVGAKRGSETSGDLKMNRKYRPKALVSS